MDSWDPGTPHTQLCYLLYSKEYTFGLHTFMVLLYVWPNICSVCTLHWCFQCYLLHQNTLTVEHCIEL